MQTQKERFAIGKISEDIYQEFAPQYQKQITEIEKELENIS